MARVILHYADGHEAAIEAAPGETILAAALRAGAPIAHQCQSGSCGTCLARVVEGRIAPVPGRALALLASEIRDGLCLTCSALAESEAVRLALAYPATVAAQATAREAAARVTGLQWLASSVIRLELTLPRGAAFTFRSGQYLRLGIPGQAAWRSYSMATPPKALPRLDLLVRYIPGGAMSEWLKSGCEIGAEVEFEGPFGGFVLAESRGRHLMVAGGTGLAPMLAMLETLRTRPGPKPPLLLCFGCNAAADLFHQDELELRGFWMPNLTIRMALVTGPLPAGVERLGTAPSLIEPGDVEPGATAYLCGPPAMIEAARERLAGFGLAREAIFAEQFRPSEV